jgi:hypothetical protein
VIGIEVWRRGVKKTILINNEPILKSECVFHRSAYVVSLFAIHREYERAAPKRAAAIEAATGATRICDI